jgi:hypothetical protein
MRVSILAKAGGGGRVDPVSLDDCVRWNNSAQRARRPTRWAIAHPLDIQATSPRVPVPQARPSLRGGTNW